MDGNNDDVVDLEFTALGTGVSPDGNTWLVPRDDPERAIVNHVVSDLDATAKFVETLARVARGLLNHRGNRPRGQLNSPSPSTRPARS